MMPPFDTKLLDCQPAKYTRTKAGPALARRRITKPALATLLSILGRFVAQRELKRV